MQITLFGCGAIGSQIAMHIAVPGMYFKFVDDDRIEVDNIDTSAFSFAQQHMEKAYALSVMVWRKCQCTSEHITKTLDLGNLLKCTKGSDLAIDCFDNIESRYLTTISQIPIVHVGVSQDRTGSIIWDKDYKIYPDKKRGEEQFCTHLAGKNIIRFTSVVGAYVIEKWMQTGIKETLFVHDNLHIYG